MHHHMKQMQKRLDVKSSLATQQVLQTARQHESDNQPDSNQHCHSSAILIPAQFFTQSTFGRLPAIFTKTTVHVTNPHFNRLLNPSIPTVQPFAKPSGRG
jgi:hypothetical protein